MSTRPPPRPCWTCGTELRFMYPGNDPENGPAGYHCNNGLCQQAVEVVEYLMVPEETKAIWDEIDRFDEDIIDPNIDDSYEDVP